MKKRIVKDDTCHKSCEYWKECNGFRKKYQHCPEWARDIPIECIGKDDQDDNTTVL